MDKSTGSKPGWQPGAFVLRPYRVGGALMNSAAARRPATRPEGWTHYIRDDFFDDQAVNQNLECLLLRFERLYKERPSFEASTEELLGMTGWSKNTLAITIKRGEELGWFKRAFISSQTGKPTGRVGFVALRRPTNRPVATPETFEQVVDAMKAAAGRRKGRPRTLPFSPDRSPIFGERATQNSGTVVPKNWVPPLVRRRKTLKTRRRQGKRRRRHSLRYLKTGERKSRSSRRFSRPGETSLRLTHAIIRWSRISRRIPSSRPSWSRRPS